MYGFLFCFEGTDKFSGPRFVILCRHIGPLTKKTFNNNNNFTFQPIAVENLGAFSL